MATITITQEESREIKGVSDAEKLRQKTDEEIAEAVKNDPDSALPTEEELKEFKRRPSGKKND